MKRALISAVVLCLSVSALRAENLDSLIRQYQEIKLEGNNRKDPLSGGKAARKTAPVLDKIAALGSDQAVRSLLKEIGQAPRDFATACARARILRQAPRRARKRLRPHLAPTRPARA